MDENQKKKLGKAMEHIADISAGHFQRSLTHDITMISRDPKANMVACALIISHVALAHGLLLALKEENPDFPVPEEFLFDGGKRMGEEEMRRLLGKLPKNPFEEAMKVNTPSAGVKANWANKL